MDVTKFGGDEHRNGHRDWQLSIRDWFEKHSAWIGTILPQLFKIKIGQLQAALALANAERARTYQQYSNIVTFRYLVGLVADFDTLVFESPWQSLADWERYWQAGGADPESMGFLQKIGAMMESGGENQLWTVVE